MITSVIHLYIWQEAYGCVDKSAFRFSSFCPNLLMVTGLPSGPWPDYAGTLFLTGKGQLKVRKEKDLERESYVR